MFKIIRSVCLFTENITAEKIQKIEQITARLQENGFQIQTKRFCCNEKNIQTLRTACPDPQYLLSVGTLTVEQAHEQIANFLSVKSINFNLDLTSHDIGAKEADFLFEIITGNSEKTFDFTFVFNNPASSPYFPSANFEKEGFSIGLQPTDLAESCTSVEEWLDKTKTVWNELNGFFSQDPEFLGIDSSVAPLFTGISSFINFVRKLQPSFPYSTTTDLYVTITKFLRSENPKPVGLCGLMFPCLEDFELADEYEKGEFSIERNIYLSLHSGLGIDTYPIGIDENKQRVVEILRLIQALSNKYHKPLSVRFVSDGKAKIGEKTDFKNQYLKDVVLRPI